MAEPLETLLAALKTKWDADSPLMTAFGTRVSRVQKPPEAEADLPGGVPYVIVKTEKTRLRFFTCKRKYWRHVVIWQIYDKSPPELAENGAKIDDVFGVNGLTLSLDDNQKLVKARELEKHYIQHDRELWSLQIPYEFITSQLRS